MTVPLNLFAVAVKGGQKGSQNLADNAQQAVNGYRYNSTNAVDDLESTIDDAETNKAADETTDLATDIDEVATASFAEGNTVTLATAQTKHASSTADIAADLGHDAAE